MSVDVLRLKRSSCQLLHYLLKGSQVCYVCVCVCVVVIAKDPVLLSHQT